MKQAYRRSQGAARRCAAPPVTCWRRHMGQRDRGNDDGALMECAPARFDAPTRLRPALTAWRAAPAQAARVTAAQPIAANCKFQQPGVIACLVAAWTRKRAAATDAGRVVVWNWGWPLPQMGWPAAAGTTPRKSRRQPLSWRLGRQRECTTHAVELLAGSPARVEARAMVGQIAWANFFSTQL